MFTKFIGYIFPLGLSVLFIFAVSILYINIKVDIWNSKGKIECIEQNGIYEIIKNIEYYCLDVNRNIIYKRKYPK